MNTRRAENVIIYIGHDQYRGFGFWWDRLVLALISGSAGLMVGIDCYSIGIRAIPDF